MRALDVTVACGKYWDAPSGRIGSALQLADAALGKPVGSQGDVGV